MISIKDLHLNYDSDEGPVHAVRGVSIEVPEGSFYTLLGPSGCGKTSTLRSVAGLEKPTSGEISLGGEIVFSSTRGIFVPPYRRKIGMVFQSYAIWPHMNVFENVAYPLKHGSIRSQRKEVRDRVGEVLSLVGLQGLEKRPAPLLSGGQQQRLALARALVTEPGVLLLDEPLSNLDARLRDEMRHEISALTHRLGITTLFVTHDQLEAFTMSDMVGVMSQGLLVQEGPPAAIYRSPSTRFVANFVGNSNIIEGSICSSRQVATPLGTLACQLDGNEIPGQEVAVLIRPEDVRLVEEEASSTLAEENIFQGNARKVLFLGPSYDLEVEIQTVTLKAVCSSHHVIREGDQIAVQIPVHACHVMHEEAADDTH